MQLDVNFPTFLGPNFIKVVIFQMKTSVLSRAFLSTHTFDVKEQEIEN